MRSRDSCCSATPQTTPKIDHQRIKLSQGNRSFGDTAPKPTGYSYIIFFRALKASLSFNKPTQSLAIQKHRNRHFLDHVIGSMAQDEIVNGTIAMNPHDEQADIIFDNIFLKGVFDITCQ